MIGRGRSTTVVLAPTARLTARLLAGG
jgi:hypothetical protein